MQNIVYQISFFLRNRHPSEYAGSDQNLFLSKLLKTALFAGRASNYIIY
jgi:hypothetical protein